MYIFLLGIHVIVCLVLVFVVLLQAGRGGGVSDMMGGGQPQSVFGTQTNAFMVRATEVCAVLFIVTSLSLGIISSHRGRSLMEGKNFSTLPVIPPVSATTKADVAKAVEKSKEAVSNAVTQASDAAKEATASVVSQAKEASKEAVQTIKEEVESKASDAATKVASTVTQAKDDATSKISAVQQGAEKKA